MGNDDFDSKHVRHIQLLEKTINLYRIPTLYYLTILRPRSVEQRLNMTKPLLCSV